MGQDKPSFEEWVEYCFTCAYDDFHGRGDPAAIESRDERFATLEPLDVAEYLCALFEASATLIERFSVEQLAAGTWFIFGVGSCYFGEIREPGVPVELQAAAYRETSRMYLECFELLCNEGGAVAEDCSAKSPLDVAVYMIWDMDSFGMPLHFRDKEPRLVVEAAYGLLEAVLRDCRAPTCLKSALHGLGHDVSIHQEPARSLIQRFLEARGESLPGWLKRYAHNALKGMVQ